MKERLNDPVTVGLTPRQKAALVAYCDYVGVSVSAHVRHLITSEVPARFWKPIPAPPGQMEIEGTEAFEWGDEAGNWAVPA